VNTAPEIVDADLVVLGAGPGGYAAAFRAADLGLDVTLVDPEPEPGGVCLFRGCIPSKALLHQAALIDEAAAAAERGITFPRPAIDLDRLRAWKREVVTTLTGGLGQLAKSRGVRRVRGRGVFLERNLLEIATHDADRTRMRFRHCIVATGSRPTVLPGLDTESPRVMTSSSALDLPDVPARLLVVGGGYIGLELATVYAALGSAVTVVEMTDGLLPGVDRDLVRVLAKRIGSRVEAVLLGTKVARLTVDADTCRVRLEGAAEPSEQTFDRVLVAAESIAGRTVAFEPAAIPAVVYTDPEIAWCGLTESQATATQRAVEIGRFPWAASGRALTLGRGDGVTKVLIDPDTHRVLGAGIVGHGAGDLIAEVVHAIEMGAVAEDLALTIHPHPTLSETVMEAADVALGQSLHVHKRRR